MPVSDRDSFPRRQTKIPTILGVRIVGIFVLYVFTVDLDLVIKQDDLIHKSVDQKLRVRFQSIEQEVLLILLGKQIRQA